MKSGTTLSESPYKFLDYYEYTLADQAVFFGRERETQILLSDIIVSRLVVLFAKTGSGKTSLINAGVRPRLEDLDYATFLVRVKKDPAESARSVLNQSRLLPGNWPQKPLPAQLKYVAKQLEKPIVIFFDQFEEFFIYFVNENSEKAQQFISDVAHVYRDRKSGVHLVFSMREEFFGEMDVFRDKIPSIFHNESNLRLLGFEVDHARDAIVLPAQKFQTKIEKDLVERLLIDLKEGERINPVKLQIVCDTLWKEKTKGPIRLHDYESLGGTEEILSRRLERDIDKSLNNGQMLLFRKLLPTMGSARQGCKYIRGFDELVENLKTDEFSLRSLVDKLIDLRLIKESRHYKATYIEWTSDYLVECTDNLQERVSFIWLKRLLESAMNEAKREPDSSVADELEAGYMSPTDFEALSQRANLLKDLTKEEGEFLFVAALQHGTYMSRWREKASLSGVNVWQILKNKISRGDRIEEAKNAVRLLGEVKSSQALKLLEMALHQVDLSRLTVKVLAIMRSKEAIDLLGSSLQHGDLQEEAEKALEGIPERREDQAADQAVNILKKWRVNGAKHRKKTTTFEPEVRPIIRGGLEKRNLAALVHRINKGQCTPFLGAGACYGMFPLAKDIAEGWAEEYEYPMKDSSDLPRVAEFLAVDSEDAMFPKDLIIEKFEKFKPSEAKEAKESREALRSLARLPLPLYITTNYDYSMEEALKKEKKNVRTEYLRWNDFLQKNLEPSILDSGFVPTPDNPVVFHLHGRIDVKESLVLTEGDHLDFLKNITKDPDLIPRPIREALASTIIMFIGYDVGDWSFRVLLQVVLRGLLHQSMLRYHIFQMPPPASTEAAVSIQRRVQDYFNQYYRRYRTLIYWGTTKEFAGGLLSRTLQLE